MRRWWGVLLSSVVLGVAYGVVPTAAAPTGPDALRVDLDQILADPRLGGSHAGVVVRDPNTHEILYSRESDARSTPASNAKLLTSAAALDTLGPDFRFRTEVRTTAEQQGSALLGDLHLRGTGDPTMLPADYDKLAADVAAAGIREVKGRLLIDDSWFDKVPMGSGWAWDDEPYNYAAPVSALTLAPNTDFDAGNVTVRVTPGAKGQPAGVQVDPPTSAVSIDNRATTSAPGTQPGLSVQRDHGTNRVVVSGSVPEGAAPAEELSSVRDPSAYAADVFVRALKAHGVSVGAIGEGVAPPDARVLAGRDSMPLSQLLVPFLKLSNNQHAEALVKAMGRAMHGDGSWDAGLRVVTEKLKALGVDPAGLRIADGSGLSSMDVVTPDQLASLLDTARTRPWFQAWYDALPVAGAPDRMVGGTLRNRMGGTRAANNVHAKTGSMTGVTSLSGFVTAANQQPLVFSVVFNDFVADAPHDLEDAIAVRLADYTGEKDQPGHTSRVPQPRQATDNPRTRLKESTLECSWTKSC